ncbi:MAG: YjjG family noncanonical pyrimidine nucleotidase [Lachnospiraceae bacterium]|nr:YjjG family noncanonical pyrimidine nucleotidase [Lachnospiraceae bacterium]
MFQNQEAYLWSRVLPIAKLTWNKGKRMRYDTILMDADETILDFSQAERSAFARTLEKYEITCTEEVFALYSDINHGLWKSFERGEISKQEILDRRFRETFQRLGIRGEFPGLEEAYQTALSEGSFIIEGADEVCRRLSEHCRLYVVTNGVAATQHRRMKESGLRVWFRDVFVSEEVGYQKPKREYFDYVFARIPDMVPERTLLVGDSLTSDIAGGKGAGVDTCWMCRSGRIEEGLGKADYIITDLRELYGIVGGAEHE